MTRTSRGEALRRERRAMVEVSREVKALDFLTLAQLQVKYRDLFGTETRTKNKVYLRKKVAWRIQERAEGGLSAEAQARIAELAPVELPVRTEPKQRAKKAGTEPPGTAKVPKVTRDARLPEEGTILRRDYQGEAHEVEVLAEGFRHRGKFHKSLSSIAKAITNTNWNGFLFFGLINRDGKA